MSADRPGAAGAVEPARPAAPRAGNMLDYARRELETFSRRGLCAVDSLILSWMAYLRIPADADEVVAGIRGWDGVRLADLHRAEYFGDYFAGMWSEEDGLRLLAAAAASPRLRDVRVVGHVESTDVRAEKQFAAVTFRLTDDLSYVAFRGTDSTLVGWKEDFNLSFRCPVPSQVAAARYLADVAGRLDGELVVGGHSKGGNLAVYAAASVPADVGERITRVFSHDGPGFLPEFLATGEFANVAPRIDKTLPQSSLVGMLLEQQEGFRVVKSNRLLIWQHDPFSWRVDGRDFVYLDDLAPDARYLDAAISALEDDLQRTTAIPMFDEPLVVLTAAGHPWAGRTDVSPTELDDQPLLLLDEGNCLRDQTLALCQRYGSQPPVAVATTLSTVTRMVAHGSGVTIIPEGALQLLTPSSEYGIARFGNESPMRRMGLVHRVSSSRGADFAQLAELISRLVKQANLPVTPVTDQAAA